MGVVGPGLSFTWLAFVGCDRTLAFVAFCVVSALNAGKYAGHVGWMMARVLACIEGGDNTKGHDDQGAVAPHKGQPDEGHTLLGQACHSSGWPLWVATAP